MMDGRESLSPNRERKEKLYDPEFDRFAPEGKAAIAVKNQDKSVLYDSTGICAFPTQLGLVDMETMA